jgi:hypothetical protein
MSSVGGGPTEWLAAKDVKTPAVQNRMTETLKKEAVKSKRQQVKSLIKKILHSQAVLDTLVRELMELEDSDWVHARNLLGPERGNAEHLASALERTPAGDLEHCGSSYQ